VVNARRVYSRVVVAVALCATGAACVSGLDRYNDVHDLRILAVRADPPELLDDPLPAQIHFDALAIDPRTDEPVRLTWQFCPVEVGGACEGFDGALATAQKSLQSLAAGIAPPGTGGSGGSSGSGGSGGTGGAPGCTFSPSVGLGLLGLGDTLGDLADPDYIERRFRSEVDGDALDLVTDGGDVTLTSVDLSFLPQLAADLRACDPSALPDDFDAGALPAQTSDLHLLHLLSNPFTSVAGSWPSVILTAHASDEELVAQKRINLTFRRPSAMLEVLRLLTPGIDFGLGLCPPAAPADADCVHLRERVTNHNPVFDDLRIAVGGQARRPEEQSDFVSLQARSGCTPVVERPANIVPVGDLDLMPVAALTASRLRILPVMTADSEEPYQTLNLDLDATAIRVEDAHEEISISWFSTGGNLQDSRTWRGLTKTLDTAWRAPPQPP